jgi:hypothetical protein
MPVFFTSFSEGSGALDAGAGLTLGGVFFITPSQIDF